MQITPFGQFIPGSTLLHRLDLRVKLFGVVFLTSSAVIANDVTDLCVIATMVLMTVVASGMPLRELLRSILVLLPFYLVTIVLHSVLTPGHIIIELPFGLDITSDGIMRGLFFSVKIALIASFTSPLMRSTHPSSWMNLFGLSSHAGNYFRRILLPLMVTMGIALRFLPLILEESQRIRQAQISRGLNFGGGLISRAASLKPLLIPLMSSSFDRVDKITIAMQSRGFSLTGNRSIYRSHKLKGCDIAVILLIITVCIVIFI
ncbi:MAG: energy-coupling factor transporter transmembrane protein EcfT [Calditrichaeota bacterium]|nr:energy-coupling factor transporter transmembrane protein EcfT [Calditrichota bacterium]